MKKKIKTMNIKMTTNSQLLTEPKKTKTGNKKYNLQVQNRQWEVKNSIGNGEAKDLICMAHGHELRGGMLEGIGVPGGWG